LTPDSELFYRLQPNWAALTIGASSYGSQFGPLLTALTMRLLPWLAAIFWSDIISVI
jgi:hypothetical protein